MLVQTRLGRRCGGQRWLQGSQSLHAAASMQHAARSFRQGHGPADEVPQQPKPTPSPVARCLTLQALARPWATLAARSVGKGRYTSARALQ